jgi:hypothetical protein
LLLDRPEFWRSAGRTGCGRWYSGSIWRAQPPSRPPSARREAKPRNGGPVPGPHIRAAARPRRNGRPDTSPADDTPPEVDFTIGTPDAPSIAAPQGRGCGRINLNCIELCSCLTGDVAEVT